MNIAQIRKHVARLLEGVNDSIERKEDKENPTDRDEEQTIALEEFRDAIESAMEDLNSAWEG